MKFTYRILPEKRLSVLRFRGSASVKDVLEAVQQFRADPAYDPAFNGIVSLDGVTTRVKIEDLKEFVGLLTGPKASTGAWSVILTEPRMTALGLIFKAAFAGSMRLEIVSNWDAACLFLEVNLPRETVYA